MRIDHNIPALTSYNVLTATEGAMQKVIEQLSTGLRINSAADDAAGLAISEKMRAQVKGLDQAVENSENGVSMLQTAEGGLGQVHSILQRMRELSVQAVNGTLTSQDRSYLQAEVDELVEQIDVIAMTTSFNQRNLLDGSCGGLWSSDKLTTTATIRGALTGRDEFGQKVSAEGNYRIDITADPGRGQVQKSNLLYVGSEGAPADVTFEDKKHGVDRASININTLTADSGTSSGWSASGDTLTITSEGVYRIYGTTTTAHKSRLQTA